MRKLFLFQVLLALTTLAAPAQESRPSVPRLAARASEQRARREAAPIRASLAEIGAHPARYYGKEVRVTGLVSECLGRAVFTLDDDDWFAADALVMVPVIRPQAIGKGFLGTEGERVTVIGRVEAFYRWKFHEEYDWFNVRLFRDRDAIQRWEGRPVIVAASIQFRSE
jgi:hypothetical protein